MGVGVKLMCQLFGWWCTERQVMLAACVQLTFALTFWRLVRWVQGECRRLGDADAPEVDPLLQRAAGALRERPVLYAYCAQEVAQARHNALFQRCAPPPAPGVILWNTLTASWVNSCRIWVHMSARIVYYVLAESVYCCPTRLEHYSAHGRLSAARHLCAGPKSSIWASDNMTNGRCVACCAGS